MDWQAAFKSITQQQSDVAAPDGLSLLPIPSVNGADPSARLMSDDETLNTYSLNQATSQTKGLPRFYIKKRSRLENPLHRALDAEAFTHLVESKRKNLLDNDDLDVLWETLCERATDGEDDKKKISYVDFEVVRLLLPPRFQQFFSASTFMKFPPADETGRIHVLQFYNYVLRKVSLMQARLELSLYDADYDGYLTEEELEKYVEELLPCLHLPNLKQSFVQFYVCTAVRKFFFFLDPQRRGKISIQNMLLSPILTELFELRDREISKESERGNWFSTYSALRVYGQYLNLDTNHNGMLSRRELARYNSGTLTAVFVDRVFQEYQTYNGEMDFKGFLDFVLVMENVQTPEALAQYFRLLDIERVGYLDPFTVRYFAKAVTEKMAQFGHDLINAVDVTNEVFDMINPKIHDRILLD
ncbi:Serine/threonine-protein phosphatase 2A regulatory subunit B'' subunit gamma, partial [Quaeritorhiza haematococci]